MIKFSNNHDPYLIKPFPGNNFCLNDCRFGRKIDLVLFNSVLILGLCLSEGNLDFIIVFAFIRFEYQFSLIDNLNGTDCPLNDTDCPLNDTS